MIINCFIFKLKVPSPEETTQCTLQTWTRRWARWSRLRTWRRQRRPPSRRRTRSPAWGAAAPWAGSWRSGPRSARRFPSARRGSPSRSKLSEAHQVIVDFYGKVLVFTTSYCNTTKPNSIRQGRQRSKSLLMYGSVLGSIKWCDIWMN